MKYEEYKDSGIEWIGRIPNHWEVCRLKSLCTLKARIGWKGLRSDEFEEESYAYLITGQDFKSAEIDWDSCYQINKERYEEDPYIQLSNGDLLITKDGTIGKIAKVTNLNKPACLNSGVFVLKQRKNQFYPNFLYWLLSSKLLADFNNYTSTGTTILHLYQNVFENMPVIVPHVSEQEKIASYLDEKCGKINGAIDVQKKKIDLLNELKQTTITNAVTKGLNPDAPMKDCGIEWIGQVPEHWEVKRLKFNSKFINGFAFKSDSFSDDGEYPVIRIGDIYNDGISYDNIVYVPLNSELDNYKVNNNDILIAMSGATVGKVGLCNSSDIGYINQRVGIVRSEIYKLIWYNLLSPKFLEYIYLMSDGSAQPNISSKGIRDYYIAIPSHEEQQEIIEYLTKKVSNIETQIAKANRRIELLNELKQSIITEAVTGKIKVC